MLKFLNFNYLNFIGLALVCNKKFSFFCYRNMKNINPIIQLMNMFQYSNKFLTTFMEYNLIKSNIANWTN